MNVLTDANGVCVLQTHDIDLAFTDSIFEAKRAQRYLTGSETSEPYNCQYVVWFHSPKERGNFLTELKQFLGGYVDNFIVEDRGTAIVLRGFCII